MKFGLNIITGIFYRGPYTWEVSSSESDAARKIEELHEGNFFDHIFDPGISASVSGGKFKVTRWGIRRIPMSGNSFVHLFVGEISRDGSKTIICGRFRLSVFVFGFSLLWLTMAYLIGGAIAVVSAKAYLFDGDKTKLSGALFGLAFPILGTFMLLGFKLLARSNEKEILDGLNTKFGGPVVRPE